jgi:hypothetical protein
MFPNYLPGGVEHKLRLVVAEFGVKETHSALMSLLQKDYEDLQSLFTQSNRIPQPEEQEQVEKKEKKPVKKANLNKESPTKEQEPTPPVDSIDSLVSTKFTPGMKILVTKEVRHSSNTNIQPLPPAELPKFGSSTEAKQWQRDQEEARRLNNEQRGIDSESLLTADNMREWIEVNKYTYAQIARDILGLPEYRVGEFAKQHGILSETAKRRAAIIARAKGKN